MRSIRQIQGFNECVKSVPGNDFKCAHQDNGFLGIDKFVCVSSKRSYFVKTCQLQINKIINSTVKLSEDYFRKILTPESSSSCFALFGLNNNEYAVTPSGRKSSRKCRKFLQLNIGGSQTTVTGLRVARC